MLVTGAVLISTQAAYAQVDNSLFMHAGSQKLLDSKDYQGAIRDFSMALDIDPEDNRAYALRGSAKALIDDYQGAIADFNKAIAIDPQHGLTYNARGIVKIDIGDKRGACDDFKKAASLGIDARSQWLNSEGGAWCRNMR